MDDLVTLFLKAILFGFLGGLAALFASWIIEKLGGAIGGVLASSPSTIIPASIGIALASDQLEFEKAMFTVPIGMWINVIFLWVWKISPKVFVYFNLEFSSMKKLFITLFASLIIWGVTSLIVTLLLENIFLKSGISIQYFGSIFLVLSVIFGIYLVVFKTEPAPSGTKKVSTCQLTMRPTLAASSIGAAVFLSNWSGIVAGLASVFPSIFMTTMVSLWLAQGESVTVGSVGPMCLGSVSVSLFALLFYYFFLKIGWYGLFLTYFLVIFFYTIPSGYLTYRMNESVKNLYAVSKDEIDESDLKEEKEEVDTKIELQELEDD